jgi:hypothetical protein
MHGDLQDARFWEANFQMSATRRQPVRRQNEASRLVEPVVNSGHDCRGRHSGASPLSGLRDNFDCHFERLEHGHSSGSPLIEDISEHCV